MTVLIHAATKKVLDSYTHEPVHGLLITGLGGVGLATIAKELAHNIVQHVTDVTIVAPESVTIPIERIRLLYEETRSVHKTPQVVIIDDADALSLEAQNALLKLLEEPVKNVYFILTTHSPEKLLQTIRSRVQAVGVKQLARDESERLLDSLKLTDEKKRQQALFLAIGLPAELTRLATDDIYFAEQVTYVGDARVIIEGSLYERFKIITSYTDRVKALKLVSVIAQLIRFSILKQKQFAMVAAVDSLESASERIEANGHVKTQLMYLMTKLP